MESLWKDLGFSLRALRLSPAFTAAALASLALGIGANTLIFIFLNAFFFKGLPIADPDRLVAIYGLDLDKQDLLPTSYPNFEDLRRQNRVFSGLAAYRNLSASLAAQAEPPCRASPSRTGTSDGATCPAPPSAASSPQSRSKPPPPS